MSDDVILDFNDAIKNINLREYDVEAIKDRLLDQLEAVLLYLFPNGEIRGHQFFIGNIHGDKGDSLVVSLKGNHKGLWNDFATGDGGNIFHLWSAARNLNSKSEFPVILKDICKWLGAGITEYRKSFIAAKSHSNNLGKPSHIWRYTDGDGNLIACIYRYETENGKQFRPWCVKERKHKAPNPRPLYNQIGIKESEDQPIILVEGEKAADALIEIGYIATTAMNGANAPIGKTDWSPIHNRNIIIWPDNDEAGITYANKVAKHLSAKCKISIAKIPENKPAKWDAYDAVADGSDIKMIIKSASNNTDIKSFNFNKLWSDKSPMPDDIIAPRILTPGGLLVFAGAPKVGKSDFILSWFSHLACGESFLGMTSHKPLKIYYCQAEIQYDYLRERVQKLPLNSKQVETIGNNLFITSQLHITLDENGIQRLAESINESFKDKSPDIIAIDPIRNLFDGGEDGSSENDNNAMMFFLKERIGKLTKMINPNCGIILVHHTRKMSKKQLEEDPFQALSGASSIRSFYTSGMLLFKPDEEHTERHLLFELRNGISPAKKTVDKINGRWIEYEAQNERLTHQKYGERLDAERDRKHDIILQIIAEESLKGNLYSANQFAEAFENKASLGGNKTIRDRISVLATKGYIKFTQNAEQYSHSYERSKFGLLCVRDMEFITEHGEIIPALPTHYKCPQTGAVLPVENPAIWVNQDEDVQS